MASKMENGNWASPHLEEDYKALQREAEKIAAKFKSSIKRREGAATEEELSETLMEFEASRKPHIDRMMEIHKKHYIEDVAASDEEGSPA